jgi:hypothetical protein
VRWICDVCRETIEARSAPRGWLPIQVPYRSASSSLELLFCEKHGGEVRDALFRLHPKEWPRELGPGCTASTGLEGERYCSLDADHEGPHEDGLGYRWGLG